MMRLFSLLVLIALLPTSALTQTIQVLSGEHADFSRLVVYFDERADWEFGRVKGGYEFRASDSGVSFDFSAVFDLIPRARIRRLEDRGNGRLFIASDCACHGDAFDLRASEVALDIKEGANAPEGHQFDLFLAPIAKEAATTATSTTVAAQAMREAQSGAPSAADTSVAVIEPAPEAARQSAFSSWPKNQRGGLPITFDQARLQTGPSDTSGAQVLAQVQTPSLDEVDAEETKGMESNDRVGRTEAALVEQIGRAAAQGLLEADLTTTEQHVEHALNPLEPDHPVTPPVDQHRNHPAIDHMSVQTSIDRVSTGSQPVTQSGQACLSDAYFRISEWGADPTEGADLAQHRATLLGEFDQANEESVLALARHYIYLTFGAEAAALARRFEVDLERPDLLVMMAEIMDFGSSRHPDAMFDQMGCAGSVALWAVLAQEGLHKGDEIDRTSVKSAFSELPLHLRRYLGAMLVQRFLDIEDRTTATQLLNSIDRAPGDHGAPVALVEAQIEIETGDVDLGATQLEDIVSEDVAISPQALLELVEAEITRNQPVSERMREIAATLAFEHRGTLTGVALKTAEVRANAHAGDFTLAFADRRSWRAIWDMTDAEAVALGEDVFHGLVADGADAVFLRYAVPELDEFAPFSGELRQAFVVRLLDLGFTKPARQVLSSGQQVPTPSERILFARIALAERKPDVALGYLVGIPEDAAHRLRAQALAMAEHHGEAASIWAALDETGKQANEAFRAEDWAQLASLPDSAAQEIGALKMANTSAPSVPLNPMSQSAAALTRSESTRAALDTLLASRPVP